MLFSCVPEKIKFYFMSKILDVDDMEVIVDVQTRSECITLVNQFQAIIGFKVAAIAIIFSNFNQFSYFTY